MTAILFCDNPYPHVAKSSAHIILRCEVGLDLDLELVNFGVKLCSSMAADCMDRTPRLESVGVKKEAIRRMDCAKQAQRLANRVKAADCDASGRA